MARQDIFATLSDDKSTKKCTSSSTKGIVKCIKLNINTDIVGDDLGNADIFFCFDKRNQTVEITGNVPQRWEVDITQRKPKKHYE